jgi:type I restriction enzyme S subunit
MSEWKEYCFSDAIEICPTVSLKATDSYSFVEMKDLSDGNRYCYPSMERKLSGGSRFKERDTLFARITPCLENGKICQITGLKNSVGFGSTEFLVFRGKKGITDNDFVFYLSRGEDVRSFAEQNFDGTSGRQRVPKSTFYNLSILLPPLPEQRAIASVLSSLDDKIDLLHRQNKTLERMAEVVYRHFFVDNRKATWQECTVSKLADHEKTSIHPNRNPDTPFYHYSIPAFDESHMPTRELGALIQSNKYKVIKNTILFPKLNPHKDKRVWLIPSSTAENSVCSTEFQVMNPKAEKYLFFLYGFIGHPENYDEIAAGVGGTSGSHQRIDPEVIFNFKCFLPDDTTLTEYNAAVTPIYSKMQHNLKTIQTLIHHRDLLLPKLMSGEVRVKL